MNEVIYSYTTEEVYNQIINKGIKYIAIDFDMTLISAHTRGCAFNPSEMVKHQHIQLINLIVLINNNKTLKVAITTFSSAPESIKDFLTIVLPNIDIPIVSGISRDKNNHIHQAFGIMSPKETLLIDDDTRNLMAAKDIGIHTMYCQIDKKDQKIYINVTNY